MPTAETALPFLSEFLPVVATDNTFLLATPGVAPHGAGLASTACTLISRNIGVILFGPSFFDTLAA